MDLKELLSRIEGDQVKFLSLQFTDVTGAVKSLDIPVSRMPDIDTYAVLPWSPENSRRARIFCDIYLPGGSPFLGDPRGILKRLLEVVKSRGWTFNVGPEPEFFLFKRNGPASIHPVPHDVGGYFDFSATDEAVRVRTQLMAALGSMGLVVEMGHHEVALGQHEIDFEYADALRAADNILTLKYTVKAIAAQYDLIASFMPKPIFGINGSGMHCHQSLFDRQGKNLFFDADDQFNLSDLAYGFIAGQLHHARALSAVVAPTVNSYKRSWSGKFDPCGTTLS
jgi:glutamine synthetase